MKHCMPRSIGLFVAILAIASLASGQMRSHKLGVGASGALYLMNSDFTDTQIGFGGGINLSYSLFEHVGLRMLLGTSQLKWNDASAKPYTTNMYSGNLYVSYDLFPHGNFNPFIFGGIGGVYFDPHSDAGLYPTGGFDKFDINYLGGAGFDYFFSEFFSVTVSAEGSLTNTDWLDGKKAGDSNDSYMRANIEFRYYFFDQEYVTKLIKALQERMKKD